MQDYRVRVGDIELQVREYKREAQPIIFLHFGGGNLMAWQRVVPLFRETYRLILVDLRGHGRSDKPRVGYHIDDMARDVVGVMQHLGLDRAHVIGSSLGAEVGLSLAANYPDRMLSLACDGALNSEYGPYGIWEGSQAEFEAYAAQQIAEVRGRTNPVFDTLEAFVAARRQVLEKHGWWNAYMQALCTYDACEIAPGKFTRSLPNWAQASYLECYFAARFEEYYHQVQCPLLLLPTEDDLQDERTQAAMLGLSKLACQAKIVAVPGWVHPYGWLLDPDEMEKTLLEFWAHIRLS